MKKIALILAIFLTLTACSGGAMQSTDLMKEIKSHDLAPVVMDDPGNREADNTSALSEFSLQLLRQLDLEKNTLISPLSIASALSMTANGAGGETLAQMEKLFGADIESLNQFLYAYRKFLPSDKKYVVSLANSIWLRDVDSLAVGNDFLQKNKDFYDAEVYKAAFDKSTKNDINRWVTQKTDGQIPKLLEEAPPAEAVMYLINALSFDAEWQTIYEKDEIAESKFTKADGDTQSVDFMHSSEHTYLSLPNATGFAKPYANGQYSFVALLPKEGVSVAELAASLDGSSLQKALKNASEEAVLAAMPKFEFSDQMVLNTPLEKLGMTDAFDGQRADFKDMATSDDGNIFINSIIHKTKIRVDEKGTKAGAVTSVEMATESAILQPPKEVLLDRPFLFMIVDSTYHFPLFLGCVNAPAAS